MVAELKINITLVSIILPITYVKIIQKSKHCNVENILCGFPNEKMTFKKERKVSIGQEDLVAREDIMIQFLTLCKGPGALRGCKAAVVCACNPKTRTPRQMEFGFTDSPGLLGQTLTQNKIVESWGWGKPGAD